MSSESRKHDRVFSRLRCWCEGENVTVYARIDNLSEGGLFLRTSTPLKLGAKAVLRFGVGEDAEIEARAVVVWARGQTSTEGPPGMGLEFEDVDAEKLEQIRQVIHGEKKRVGEG